MNAIIDKENELINPNQVITDEYLNETDGLLYCSRCHTPRQCSREFMGKVLVPTIKCRCQQEKQEREDAQRKKQEHLLQISRLKANGIQDKSLRDYNFANDKGYNPEIQKAYAYVEHWQEMKANSTGLLLWGDVGTGKTFFAGCIANALLEQGVPVLMTNFPKILSTLTGMYSDDRNRFIDSFNQFSLLIIDDLGIERSSEFALEQVFNVIDSRYRSKKSMIVTTNLPLDELKHPKDLARARIYDRVLERCVPLKINNQNIRELNASANIQQTRKMLCSGT